MPRRGGRGIVVALIGLPGAGKSTVARRLVDRLGLELVDRDRIRAAMFPRCRFSAEEKRAANDAVWSAVRANCALGRPSVVDGMCFSTRADREALGRVATRAGFSLLPVWLDCPLDVACGRVASDAGHPAGDRTPGLVREVADRFDAPGPDALRVDAEQGERRVAEQVLSLVRRRMLDDRRDRA